MDGGKSWSALKVVIKNSSQPSPVYDTVRRQIVMNYNGAPHCMTNGCGFNMQMISVDGGESWIAPTQLDQFLGDKGHSAAGPGVGLQLTHGPHAGRLLFIGHHGAYVWDSVWYSDNGGRTYNTSDTILEKMDEAQLVENRDGLVIANMRHREAKTKGRAVALSNNSGASFSKIGYNSDLVSPVCQGTIIRSNTNGDVYFANPASSSGRSHGRVKRSADGITFQEKEFAVTDGAFGYSCLTNLPQKDSIGLLWEVDKKIVFSTIPLDF
jgi:sialidase-1